MMKEPIDWQSLTPAERDALVSDKIMSGKLAAYSTDMDAAYTVADAMAAAGCNVSILVGPKGRCCSIWDADKPVQVVKVETDSIPEAVCWAAVAYRIKYSGGLA